MERYGVLLPRFWTGPTGRALRKRGGPTTQLLAVYLCSNSHTNMIGLYPISLAVISDEIPQTRACVVRGLRAAADEGFADYDYLNGCIWVREMARFRLGLQPGEQLANDDKRARGANLLYSTLPPNRFLGPFFDRYWETLRLRHRRAYVENLFNGGGNPVTDPGVAEA